MMKGAATLSPELLAPLMLGSVPASWNACTAIRNTVIKLAALVSAKRVLVHVRADTAAFRKLNQSVVGQSRDADILV